MLLETERLLITALAGTDARFIIKLVNSPTWLRFIGDRQIHSVVDAKQYLLNGPLQSYERHGYGFWKVMLKETRMPIGMCGFIKRNYLEHADIGYALLPEHAGMGYAYEAASACMAYGAASLGLTQVMAIVDKDNERSVKLLKKLGMHYKGNITVSDMHKDVALYVSHDVSE